MSDPQAGEEWEMAERKRIADRTIDGLKRFSEKLKLGEVLVGTTVTIEETPDGPLTTQEKRCDWR